jgi:hypothetical protein
MKTIAVTIIVVMLFVAIFVTIPTFAASPGEPLFWQGIAYSNTGAPVTTPILESGKSYWIVVSYRFWYDQPGRVQADAQYYTNATAEYDLTNWLNHYPAPDGHSFLQIDGADVNWGPFSNGDTGHTYYIAYVGKGAPITFQIIDWMDHDYTNNDSHIYISIYGPAVDYMTVNRVLNSDYYVLYPYENDASLSIGFSKYGEMINSEANVGLEYAEVDPFAYPIGNSVSSTVPKRMWVQGWFINISYTHRTQGPRNVWAMAIHADSIAYDNDWIRVEFPNDKDTTYGLEDPRDPGYLIYDTTYPSALTYGGRKTNGTAVTDPIEVLYDGPREFIAVCRTTIYDHLSSTVTNSTDSDVALVQIAITIRFDKVKKDVVLLKDVKSLLVEKEGLHMKVQFSNRGEVDLGTEAVGISSYAHFYVQGVEDQVHITAIVDGDLQAGGEGYPTVYNSSWEIMQTEDPEDTMYPGYSAAGPYPQSSDATVDVAQAINPLAGYVWSAAFWPSLSDWSIDGWDCWWHSMTANDPHYVDGAIEEPFIPFYIGEWDFVLYHTLDVDGRTQFRGVTQYSVTDWHDGDDADMPAGSNVLDSEHMYYLDETFNPWDLQAASEKDTRRWLEWKPTGYTGWITGQKPVVVVPDAQWDDYCNFADRVIDMVTGQLLNRADGDYALELNADGTATFSDLPTHMCKILYSTEPYWYDTDLIDLTPMTVTVEGYTPGGNVTFMYGDDYTFATDPLGVQHSFDFEVLMDYVLNIAGDSNFTDTIGSPSLDDVKYDFGVGFETGFEQNFYFWNNVSYADSNMMATCISLDPTNLNWYIDSTKEGVWINMVDVRLYLSAFINYTIVDGAEPATTLTITFMPEMLYAYEESIMGTYEWVTVGRDAATVDSAGSALVAEAFDSLKQIGVGIAGADMVNPLTANQMPNVMAQFTSGSTVSDYKDTILRAALADDWCTYWPVASSDMIAVGGPIANLLAYYANDFTDAFYGLTEFAGTAYAGRIVPIPCWNRNWPGNAGYNTYASSTTTGYAVITTYKDINGTVLFNVWGHWGRDTYYASMWLHGDEARGMMPGLIQLQSAPAGTTSIILKINYADPKHPTYTIPEVLGTISETSWYHSGTDVTSPYKGGIHDP